MAYVLADRVKETSTTTGTGALTLAGAAAKFQAFSNVCANADTVPYYIEHQTANEWEVGYGSWGTGGILNRTTVYRSSNGSSLVSFSAGTKDVALTLLAEHVVAAPDIVWTTPTLLLGATTGGVSISPAIDFYSKGAATVGARITVVNQGGNGGAFNPVMQLVSTGVNARGQLSMAYGYDTAAAAYKPNVALSKNAGDDISINIGNRFQFGATGDAETGNNAGSDFYISRFNDSGTVIDTPVTIHRDTGFVQANRIGIDIMTALGALSN